MKADLLKTLQGRERFLISTHVNPDPDALASMAALGLYLRGIGKTVHLVLEEPVPERFNFLPEMDKVKPLKDVRRLDYDAAIITDAGDMESRW
jgi:phosphoesterase RecJ-like protein